LAIIRCSECGRAVSDRASACIGCGAPLLRLPGFDWVPQRSAAPPPSSAALRRRSLIAALGVIAGILWSRLLETEPGQHRIGAALAAMLLVVALCGLIVTLVQSIAARR
jgi:hypothetical protein